MRRRRSSLLILAVLSLLAAPALLNCGGCALAQTRTQAPQDSLRADSAARFSAGSVIVPGSLMAAGAVMHFAAHESVDVPVNNWTSTWKGDSPALHFDDYVQFVPEAMHLGLGLLGAKSEHRFVDRGIEAVWAFGSLALIRFGMKSLIDSPRPDGSDNRSFPSGHAGFAFAGAELVRMEYGWGWGAGAYAVATGVSVMRLYNNEHWLSDLIFGAGTGILCAHVGGWLLGPTKRLLGIGDGRREGGDVALSARVDPLSGAICPTLALTF